MSGHGVILILGACIIIAAAVNLRGPLAPGDPPAGDPQEARERLWCGCPQCLDQWQAWEDQVNQ